MSKEEYIQLYNDFIENCSRDIVLKTSRNTRLRLDFPKAKYKKYFEIDEVSYCLYLFEEQAYLNISGSSVYVNDINDLLGYAEEN